MRALEVKADTASRALTLALAVALLVAAVFPELALAPIDSIVRQMRAPDTAADRARPIFAAGAVAFATAFLAWKFFAGAMATGVRALLALDPARFWTVLAVCTCLPRLLASLISYEPLADASWYHATAASLARGEGLAVQGQPTAYRGPGYSFLLSLAYRVGGDNPALAWLWGMLATAVIVIALHRIGGQLYDEGVGRLAACMGALYPALVLMTGQVMSDLPFVAGLLALIAYVLACAPYRLVSCLVAGLGIGLLTLVRPVAIGLIVVVPLIWMLRKPDGCKFALALAMIVPSFLLCVSPWVLRNQAVFGAPVLGTNLGMNAYGGNRPGASGGADRFELPPQVEASGDANEAQRDALLLRAAMDFVIAHPVDALAKVPGALLHLYLLETEVVSALFQGPHPSPASAKHALYGLSQFSYAAVLMVLLIRILSWQHREQRPRGTQWAGCLIAAYFTAVCLVLHAQDRYRLPILPWMLIEGSVVLTRLAAYLDASVSLRPRDSA